MTPKNQEKQENQEVFSGLLTRKAVKFPETAVVISQALVGAVCIIRMHHFDVLSGFMAVLSILIPSLSKNRVKKALQFRFFARKSYLFTSSWLC